MNAIVSNREDGDGRISVSLAELIALRGRAARLRLPPQESHAGRSGQQSSRLFGRGMDYAESRVYQSGDDVRRLDWRLTARSGKLHTKLFQEEREGSALTLLDDHPSMHFGTRVRYKSVQAARAAALAAWYIIRAGERTGLMTFGPHPHTLKPRPGVTGALGVCGLLARPLVDAGSTREPLSQALQRVTRLQHGANRLLLISDGVSCDEHARRRLLDVMRHASVRVLIVADMLELQPAAAGRYPIDYAGGRYNLMLQTSRQREAFQRDIGAGQARLSALAQSLNIPWRCIDTTVDPFDAVKALLCERGRKA